MQTKVERLDHLGVVTGVMRDLKISQLIDDLVGTDSQEEITTGEAVVAMILNGLGFSDRPLMLTPQFFENKPLRLLFCKDVEAETFNRYKLGRALDTIYDYGCQALFSKVAMAACVTEKVDQRYQHADTTTFSLSGQYNHELDGADVVVAHGYSKDKRPDLKQVILELLATQDAGIPLAVRTWKGNESDNVILAQRAKELVEKFKASNESRCLIADSKLYFAGNAASLSAINFITRVPSTIKKEHESVATAVSENVWSRVDDDYQLREFPIFHFGFPQRWIVVQSEAARTRAVKSVERDVARDYALLKEQLGKAAKRTFACQEDAEKEITCLKKKARFHTLEEVSVESLVHHEKPGRPSMDDASKKYVYRLRGTFVPKSGVIETEIAHRACFVLATTVGHEVSPDEILRHYKGQDCVEKGFAFLKHPSFFASSLFLKKESRIQALLVVMTLALLVYSIGQRRLRSALKTLNETLPNQINRPTKRPTLRWIFQILDGISVVTVSINNVTRTLLDGMTSLRKKILAFFGHEVAQIYGVAEGEGCPM